MLIDRNRITGNPNDIIIFKKPNIIWDLRGIGREREKEMSKQPELIEGKGCWSAAPVVLCCIIKKSQIGLD